ncbi:unnamed protein product [Symbiodinium natans]|uniref:Uncharacterized protein n=1 Tax=Symbiodinium natans TaxID=878477 RepID=A0A812N5S6_9DINO|nr:unnamed protein product [Symbiodinium natans]
MARKGFAIRLRSDPTVVWRIGMDELVARGESLCTSTDLGLFSQDMKAKVCKEWSEMYLEDVPGGELQLVNDLDAALELNKGNGWRILYPNHKRRLAKESFSIRLREDPAVMSTIVQFPEFGTEHCLRTSKDLEEFSSKASSWTANEQKAIQKETGERQHRKKMSEAKVERSARKLAVIWFLAIACAAVVLIPGLSLIGMWSHTCAGLGAALLCFLPYWTSPRSRRSVCVFEAVSWISARCGIAAGAAMVVASNSHSDFAANSSENTSEEFALLAHSFRHHPMTYLFFVFAGMFAGTCARSIFCRMARSMMTCARIPAGGFWRKPSSFKAGWQKSVGGPASLLGQANMPPLGIAWSRVRGRGRRVPQWFSFRRVRRSLGSTATSRTPKVWWVVAGVPLCMESRSLGVVGGGHYGLRTLRKRYSLALSSMCISSSKHAARAKSKALTSLVKRI